MTRVIRTLLINAPLVIAAFLFSVPTLLAAINVDPSKVVESPALNWLVKDLENVNSNVSQLLSTWVPSLVIVIANNVMFALLDLASKCDCSLIQNPYSVLIIDSNQLFQA